MCGAGDKWQGIVGSLRAKIVVNIVFSVGLLALCPWVLIFYVQFSYALCEQWYNGRYSLLLASHVLEHNSRETDDGSLRDNTPTGSGPNLLMKAER